MIKPITRSPTLSLALDRGWNLYKENFAIIFPATLLTMIIAAVSCGICAGPMMSGLLAMLVALLRKKEPKPQIGDVFGGFSRFAPTFLTSLLLSLIFFAASMVLMVVPVLGQIAAVAVGWFISPAVTFWALMLVTDQGATFGEAISTSLKLVGDKVFWPMLLVAFVAGLLGAVGAVACGIGVLVTLPFTQCMMAAAYEEVCGSAGETGDAPVTPEVLPPAQ